MCADDFRYLGPSFILVPVPASTTCKNFFSVLYRLRRWLRFRFSFLSVEDDFRYLTIFGAGSAYGELSVEDDFRYLAIFHAGSVSGQLSVKDYFRYLTIFHAGSVVVSGRIAELECHLAPIVAVH
jgi:hypothetical protein